MATIYEQNKDGVTIHLNPNEFTTMMSRLRIGAYDEDTKFLYLKLEKCTETSDTLPPIEIITKDEYNILLKKARLINRATLNYYQCRKCGELNLVGYICQNCGEDNSTPLRRTKQKPIE